MDKIAFEPSPTTPRVHFDPQQGYFEISGKSLPENSFDFYKPLLDWMDEYLKNPANQSNLVFKLEYFNTSSTAHFLRLIKKLEKIHSEGGDVVVQWYHDHEDEDMREAGEDFRLLVKMPIDIIATNLSEDE